MKRFSLCGIGCLVVLAALTGMARADQILLQDDFNDNSLDPSKWTINIDKPLSSVVERNQHIEIANRGFLISVNQFDPTVVGPLHLTGTWTFILGVDNQTNDYMETMTRTDGIPLPGTAGLQNGIEFNATYFNNKMWINRLSTLVGFQPLAETSIDIRVGDTFQFDIIDDGNNISFTMREVGGRGVTQTLTASDSTHFDQNRIAFYDRTLGDQRQNLSYLDDVVLTGNPPTNPIPEPTTLTLMEVGVMSVLGYGWRRRGSSKAN